MKTDRELLELAARAYGLLGYIHEWINGPEFIVPGENPVTFNPLQDDGDALRLKVKAKIPQHLIEHERGLITLLEPHITGEFAIERRAITRAAAQMQLNKEQNT